MPDCKDCNSKKKCLSGCRARAYLYNKSFQAKDNCSCNVYNEI